MSDKKLLEDTKEALISLREMCMKELLDKKEILDDKEGEVKKLLSIAKEMMLNEKIEELLSKSEEQEKKLREWKEFFESRMNDNTDK